jgi:uncharacterized Ntn-hydrolase superfamily protein
LLALAERFYALRNRVRASDPTVSGSSRDRLVSRAMTFSIVARDDASAQIGIAVASKFLGVGALVPVAVPGVGAVATQANANLRYRDDGIALLRDGRSAADVVAALTSADDKRDHRQVGVVAATGSGESYTGSACIPWAGHRFGEGYAVQGNCLAGEQVVDAAESAWLAASGPLSRRLLTALAAGDDAGGDKRGRQSAALLVVEHEGGYGGGSDTVIDLRVDDHAAPVPELARLLDLHDIYFGTPDPATLLDMDEVADEVANRLRRLGFDDLETWMGNENYEERWVDGKIDPVVLAKLREATP